jgi:hypothetical protein
MVKMVTLKCKNPKCGKEFIRRAAEHKRNQKIGRNTFCCLSCHQSHLTTGRPATPEARERIRLYSNNKLDEYSKFRKFFSLIKKRAKDRNFEFNLTLESLKELWDKQNGKCVYSGLDMDIPENSKWETIGDNKNPIQASVDRIDSSKGYTTDNIQFICMIANLAKSNFDEESFLQYCRAVADHSK